MLSAPLTSIVADGQALIIGEHAQRPKVQAVNAAILAEIQELENATWGVINSFVLANNPTGVPLYNLADLVGAPTAGFTDTQIQVLTAVWCRVNRSRGRSEDMIQIMTALSPTFVSSFTYTKYGFGNYGIVAQVANADAPAAIAAALSQARPKGQHGAFAWGTWPTQTFFFGGYGVTGSGLANPYGRDANLQGLLMGLDL